MLSTVLRYGLRYPGRIVSALRSDPAGLFDTLRNRLARREQPGTSCHYDTDLNWEVRLHTFLGHPWPCRLCAEFDGLWPEVVNSVRVKGVDVGPLSFAGYNDGDTALVRAIWALVRHGAPRHVIETGVAHGFTSRFILEAMERNGFGRLWSIDLPPLDPAMRAEIGIAVGDRFQDRWTLLSGTSRRHLPPLLRQIGTVDLFVHDSLHTESNVRFEMNQAWARLQRGGAIVVDDIDTNWGFRKAVRRYRARETLVGEAEPVRPDLRRFNHRGLFGIVLKEI